ncbi:hypothetical protein BT69DRAFT_1328798 [Atractiella rhizophila]|nr:hypothetical protein BT69DRAFT_1328798 [Atractiella rhizophila]
MAALSELIYVVTGVKAGGEEIYFSPTTTNVASIRWISELRRHLERDINISSLTLPRDSAEACRLRLWKVKNLPGTFGKETKQLVQSIQFFWNSDGLDIAEPPKTHFPLELDFLPSLHNLSSYWPNQPNMSELHVIAEVLPFLDPYLDVAGSSAWLQTHTNGIFQLARFEVESKASFPSLVDSLDLLEKNKIHSRPSQALLDAKTQLAKFSICLPSRNGKN